MAPSPHLFLPLAAIAAVAVFLRAPAAAAEPMTEAEALMHLKKSFSNSSSLSSWLITDTNKSPCAPGSHEWHGVVCAGGKVAGLRLSGLQLGGTIDVDALSAFPDLRSVSFAGNAFAGPLPGFHRLTALKSMFLSDNAFSGHIPDDFFPNLGHLKKLWLDRNHLWGPVPPSVSQAAALIELHLERNALSGAIPDVAPPAGLKSFDVSDNDLDGVVPERFRRRFPADAFKRNQFLCYDVPPSPGKVCKRVEATHAVCSDRTVLLLAAVIVMGIVMVVFLRACGGGGSPGRVSDGGGAGIKGDMDEATPPVYMVKQGSTSTGSTGRRSTSWLGRRSASSSQGGAHRRSASAAKADDGSTGGGDLVMLSDCKGVFGLTDLMKAAAEVIGGGGSGSSAYKAVMASGVAVVVKRARDMNRAPTREAFEAEMKRLGGMRHANLLPPLAYHYRKDEKLLVYEYIPKGSLLYVLHGDRGMDYAALADWPTRLKVAAGVARGAAFLHAGAGSSSSSQDEVPHGNLKSSNVLLAPDFEPLLVDFGFSGLVSYGAQSPSMFSRRAPECSSGQQATPKADVYCLGVVLLELLTGKFPSQYLQNAKGGTDLVMWATSALAEGYEQDLFDPAIVANWKFALPDMKRLMEVAVKCVESDVGRRPEMKDAAARVEDAVAAALATVSERQQAGGRSMKRVTSVVERSSR